jgi:hypothetical protein
MGLQTIPLPKELYMQGERDADLGVLLQEKSSVRTAGEEEETGIGGRGEDGIWDWSRAGACCGMASICAAWCSGFFAQVLLFLLLLILM